MPCRKRSELVSTEWVCHWVRHSRQSAMLLTGPGPDLQVKRKHTRRGLLHDSNDQCRDALAYRGIIPVLQHSGGHHLHTGMHEAPTSWCRRCWVLSAAAMVGAPAGLHSAAAAPGALRQQDSRQRARADCAGPGKQAPHRRWVTLAPMACTWLPAVRDCRLPAGARKVGQYLSLCVLGR